MKVFETEKEFCREMAGILNSNLSYKIKNYGLYFDTGSNESGEDVEDYIHGLDPLKLSSFFGSECPIIKIGSIIYRFHFLIKDPDHCNYFRLEPI